ncbi:MAG: hypothetical protein ACP5SF_05355 [Thermoplasmata archaeon]
MSNKCYIYANDDVVSYLYDRPDCTKRGTGDHKCDVILMEFSDKNLWVIECKSKVDSQKTANTAVTQINGCLEVIHIDGKWKIKKCVIAESFCHDVVLILKNYNVLHYNFSSSKEPEKKIINAVKKIKGF